jgi:predicted CoA-binding protein
MRTPEQILAESTTIAVVGASRHAEKAAYAVPLQIRLHGWNVIPVNPYVTQIWDVPCYPDLASVPTPVDLVNVFRPSAEAGAVVRDAIAIGARAVWLQQGIVSPEGRTLAAEAGVDYVENACIAVIRALNRLTKS